MEPHPSKRNTARCGALMRSVSLHTKRGHARREVPRRPDAITLPIDIGIGNIKRLVEWKHSCLKRCDKLLDNVTGNKSQYSNAQMRLGKRYRQRKCLFSYRDSRKTQCVCIKCRKRLISWDERAKCLKNPTVRNSTMAIAEESERRPRVLVDSASCCCNYIG